MAELNRTSSQIDYPGLTLWDLRSDADSDDLNLTGFENQIQVKLEKESDHSFAPVPGPRARDNSLGQQISELSIKKEPSLSQDKLLECQSIFSESRYGSVDESQIDDEGWFVEEQERVAHGRGESEKDGSTVRKRPFEDSNLEGSGKIINLADFGLGDVADQRDKKKRRKHRIITTTTNVNSKEIGSQNPNMTSDPKFSCSSVGQIGSMSLNAYHQQLNGVNKRQRSSDVDVQLRNEANQPGNNFRNILDEAVKMADEAILNRVSSGNVPRQYVCKSFHFQAKTGVPLVSNQGKSKDSCPDETTRTLITNEGKRNDAQIDCTMKTMGPDHGNCGDHGITKSNNSEVKQKPRPSQRARILRRLQPRAKPTNGDGRTFLALIPVDGSNSNYLAKTSGNKVHHAKKDEIKRRSNRIIRKLLPKPSEAELKDGQTAQPMSQVAVPDQLIGGPSKFHHIAPQTARPSSRPVTNQLIKEPSKFRQIAPKPAGPRPIVVPVFEIVPVKMQTEKIKPVKPKTSSRRKQDPLSTQTGGENWRLEESEVIVEESQEDEENLKRKQYVGNLILDSEEEEEEEEDDNEEEQDDDDEEGDDDEDDQNIDLIWEEEMEGVKIEVVDDHEGEAGAKEERKEWPFIKYEVNTDEEH